MSSIQYTIEAELSSAKNRLANLQKQQQQQQQNTVELSPSSNNTESLTPAQQLYQRAIKAKDDMEYITLNQSLIEFMSGNVANSSNQSDGSDVEELIKATEMCTSLGLLLLQHSNNHQELNNEGRKSTKLYNETLKWYTNLYNTTRTKSRTIFAAQLYKSSEFPSTEQSSTIIKEALVSSNSSLNGSGKCLVELQIVHDIIMQLQSNTQGQQRVELPTTWRLDIVDELCKPIANRIKFLFLNEETGIMSSSSGQQPQTGNAQHQQQQSKIERLPEWTFRYLREVIDNHGVLLVMEDGVQPLIDTVMDTLIPRISLLSTSDIDMDDNQHTPTSSTSKAHEIIQQLKDQYYSHSTTYFLREISRMARHVLRSKSFFQHPDVVGSECQDRSIVLKGIEQLFLFDTFIEDKMKDIGVGYSGVNMSILPIRMLDTFLSSNESLLRWWLEEERDGIIATLHECGSSSLSSYQNDEDIFTTSIDIVDKEEGDMENTSSVDRLYPPISELFIALLHSARSKSNMFMSHQSRQMYIGNVIAAACSVYLDLVHAEATHLRKQLLARPPSTSSSSSTGVPSVNVLRSTTNLPSDKLLTCNTMEWSALITGTHLASQLLLQPSSSSTDISDDNSILEKVGVSMQHLCSAMVDDYTSALVETIIMERAKLASYMMRAPFLLSDPLPDLPELPLSGPERRGQRDKDTSNDSKILALSPDLNDSMHVVSVSIKACNEVKVKVGSMFQVDDSSTSGEVEPSIMLYHGCQSIHDAIKCAIGQKLLDIALDPQGMCPEIYQSGAQQFQHDVKAFNRLFNTRQPDQQPGPMERVVTSARLMSLESSQIHSLRETFRSLVDADSPIRNLFGRTVDDSGEMNEPSNSRLDVDDFYKDQRLLDEASNMLEAKGVQELSLEEVLSVLNRRL